MKALLLKNKVVQVAEKEFPVHKDMEWMDAPEGCSPGWIKNADKLEAPLPKEKSKEEMLEAEYPGFMQMINALWDWAVNDNKTKINDLEIVIQNIHDKHNVPRG